MMTSGPNAPRRRTLLSTAFCSWLPIAVAATLTMALVYITMQQSLRHSANDPQIQIAEDTAAMLAAGQAPSAVIPSSSVDVARSLAPYTVVFDDSARPVASSAILDGQIPAPPEGVFRYAADHGENRLTWQPRPGVRSAAVVVRYQGAAAGYVLVGRSLREVEQREDQLLSIVAPAWLATLGAVAVATILAAWLQRPGGIEPACHQH